jgi:hypothetical protein
MGKHSGKLLQVMKGLIAVAWMALLSGAILPLDARGGDEQDVHHIVQIIKGSWERPDNPVDVRPVAISQEYAVAGWITGERGGRALLKKADGAWRVVLCSGDGIRTASGLVAAGVPQPTAETLQTSLAQGEAALPADVVRKFSLFEGSVPVEDGAHPAHDPKHSH